MNRMTESGLEVNPHTSPEVAPQPNGSKYYMRGGATDGNVFGPLHQSNQSGVTQRKNPGQSRVIWVVAAIAVVLMAAALGAGLGAGLAAQHKSSSSSAAPITTTIQSGSIATITRTPATPSSLSCPTADGSTYTATNKPLPTLVPQVQARSTHASLSFEILCYTTFGEGGPTGAIDLQIITNVTSFNDCLDACALYNFQMRTDHFPANACTGLGWGRGNDQQPTGNPWPVCWLKSNVTLSTPNSTATWPGYDSAVLLGV